MEKEVEVARLSTSRSWVFHVKAAGIASALYIWSYYLTVALVAPLQKAVFPALVMSLVFFPHGVRVITAWLYGWRSILYLLPGALLCNFHFAGASAMTAESLSAMTTSLVAAPLAFTFAGRMFPRLAISPGKTSLRTVMLVGFLASAFNFAALLTIHSFAPVEGVVIFVGDTSGLLLCTLLVRLALNLVEPRR